MVKNPLIKKYGKEKRWVNYKKATREGKTTKLPYTIKGKLASSTEPSDWATYEEALGASKFVGIVFAPDKKLLGIDIDHCLKDKTINHELKETIADFILESDTYCEISPSGEGLHFFLAIKDGGLDLVANKKAPFECYTSGRYFTATFVPYGKVRDIRVVKKEEAVRLLQILGYPWKKGEVPHETPKNMAKSVLTDEEILRKMFKSKGGAKILKLYGGDLSDYKGDDSSADMALLSHLAFWTGKDSSQMERIWLGSPLGSREKTKKREDYRLRSINAAILSCKSTYENSKMRMEKENPDLELLYVTGAKGAIVYLQNTENMSRIIKRHPDFGGKLRYDIFRNVIEIKKKEKWKIIEDNDAVAYQTAISVKFSDWFGKVGKDMVYDAMIKVAKDNEYDSALDYVQSLKWDKKYRLNDWLHFTYGVEKNIYHEAVASNWMKGLVNRIVNPGCKFDYVLVLEGEQGSKKSTSLSILGGDWHVETTMSTDSKDFFMQFQGKAIIEFSEGETLSRTEVKRMKAIITMQSDKYRPPYERVSQDFPRRCVFSMTTNQSEYLKDETGNRRWLPVTVIFPEADIEWLRENRDQLFAEAYHRLVEKKEKTYEFPKEETLREQQKRRISDPNADLIMEWYYSKVSDDEKEVGITIDRVYKEALHGNFPSKPINKFEQMSIAFVLKDHLNLTKKQTMVKGIRQSRWFNDTGKPMKVEEENEYEEAVRNF